MKAMDLGYDKKHRIYIPLRDDTKQSYGVLKNRLLKGRKSLM